nr:reverse transcriptase domain-containing protein [Tanacetum cinerariifolium]
MLGEHNITYRTRTSVKGQVLADFLAEMPNESPPDASVVETQQEPWILFTDGSSCMDGSGTGLILTNSKGTKFTYALRFQFVPSNNEAEYEALIASLRIAVQMGVRNVYVSVDSKMVANQVLGAYIAKEENIIKYMEKVKSLVNGFTNFSINQVLVEIVKEKYIQEKEVTTMVEEDRPTWMTPIIEYLKKGLFPVIGKKQANCVSMLDSTNYWRGFSTGGKVKILIVSIDYFMKRIEVKAVATINGNQIEELPHVLWAHRTMIKSSHGDTPYSLTYGTEAVIPAEIRMPTYRTAAMDTIHNDEELRLNLDLLEEGGECVAIREAKAKLKMTKYYNAGVHGVTFRPGYFVYHSNDASHAVDGWKLGPKWEGPYEVTKALGDGAYKLRSADKTVLLRTWNVANLEKCYL